MNIGLVTSDMKVLHVDQYGTGMQIRHLWPNKSAWLTATPLENLKNELYDLSLIRNLTILIYTGLVVQSYN